MYTTIEFKTKKEALKKIKLIENKCKIIKTLNNKYIITFDFIEI